MPIRPTQKPPPLQVWQIKATLLEVTPTVWRRFRIGTDATFADLHDLLQLVMGWTNSHLHQFHLPGLQVDYDDDEGRAQKKSERLKLRDSGLAAGTRFIYEYDFGDSWEHEIRIEKICLAQPGQQLPVCLAGKRRCPPEDCGGPYGYTELLAILRDPAHEEHEQSKTWAGEEFDPDAFDLDSVNRMLQGGRPRRSWSR